MLLKFPSERGESLQSPNCLEAFEGEIQDVAGSYERISVRVSKEEHVSHLLSQDVIHLNTESV